MKGLYTMIVVWFEICKDKNRKNIEISESPHFLTPFIFKFYNQNLTQYLKAYLRHFYGTLNQAKINMSGLLGLVKMVYLLVKEQYKLSGYFLTVLKMKYFIVVVCLEEMLSHKTS